LIGKFPFGSPQSLMGVDTKKNLNDENINNLDDPRKVLEYDDGEMTAGPDLDDLGVSFVVYLFVLFICFVYLFCFGWVNHNK